ncbi:cytochrome c biogenesis protein CcsA [Desertimonas flava]|jgi:heme exporter protein C|uniref:cytochrome c biogenesis protein CcsA n=1 Tax=Desertimonas flava TaxID=2064846 RepID=UPI000E34C2AB|nr:cytochrome c biogenesis protein CcsA [Desertimonas flava]
MSAETAGTTGSARTGTTATRNLGIACLAGCVALAAFALVFSPRDYAQKDAVRLIYLHVPTVWVAYLAFGVTAIASATYLFSKKKALGWDRLAGASAEVGVLFMAQTLLVGALWGRLTWGVFWQWDARLTTTAFLFVTYIGYLAVRGLGGSHQQRAKRSAILGLLAVLEIPLVHFSVEIWRSLHQEASVLNPNGDVHMEGMMLFTMFFGLVVFTLVFAWLVIHRMRTLAAEDLVDDLGLDHALDLRRRESLGSATVPTSGGTPGASTGAF